MRNKSQFLNKNAATEVSVAAFALCFCGNLPVHAHGVVLADSLGHLQDFHADGLLAKLNLQPVAHLDIIGRLGRAAVDRDTGVVAGVRQVII